MGRHVTYEIHVLQKGRWEIHARHESAGMDSAIEEARGLDKISSIDEVKVIREIYDDESGNSREYNVFRSPAKVAQESAAAAQLLDDDNTSGAYGLTDDIGYEATSRANAVSVRRRRAKRGGKEAHQITFTGVLVKILIIILFSVTLGGLVAVGAAPFLRDTSLSNTAQTNIMFVIFILSFLFSAIVMSMNFMGRNELKKGKARPVRAPAPVAAKKQKRKKIKKVEKKNKQQIPELIAPSEEALASTATEDAPILEMPDEPEEEEFDTPHPIDDVPHPIDDVPEQAATDALTPHAEKQRVYLMKFLGGGLESTQSDVSKLDSFNKFGLNMFLAGACETLGQKRNLDAHSLADILAQTVSLMGFKASDAAKFSESYEDYLLADSRYMQMFQAGRNAMNHTLEEEPDANKYLGAALAEWNKPKERNDDSGPVTVLFTDIAGSTAMTQDLGDAVAQQIVRAHNRIVRDALTEFSGKEIKHTGDGIMASFTTTSHGVEGAINMQLNTARHNENNPDLPLHIKIGINAGEPIAEDNDLFGSTVQMAARIVDKAKADEIFVSEIVRGICAGKPLAFKNRGEYEMKGFDAPPTLYEATWRD